MLAVWAGRGSRLVWVVFPAPVGFMRPSKKDTSKSGSKASAERTLLVILLRANGPILPSSSELIVVL